MFQVGGILSTVLHCGLREICSLWDFVFLQYHRWILGKSGGTTSIGQGRAGGVLSFSFWSEQDGSGMRTSEGQSSSVSWRCSQTEMDWIWVEEGQWLYQEKDAMIGSDRLKGREGGRILLLRYKRTHDQIHLWVLCPPDDDCQQN